MCWNKNQIMEKQHFLTFQREANQEKRPTFSEIKLTYMVICYPTFYYQAHNF